MDNNRFRFLLEQYIGGGLDKEQATELLHLLDEQPMSGDLEVMIDKQLEEHEYDQDAELPLTRQRIMEGLGAAISNERRTGVRRMSFVRRFGWAAAALFVLLAGGATWWLISYRQVNRTAPVVMAVQDVKPGHKGAQLKLSDNRVILVDTAKDGLIAMDGKVSIYKQNGQIIYKGANEEEIYNEMVTDKGRQYSATLPDGSVVWLNSMSSLRYPLHFTGSERAVTLTGEGKFKVVRDARKPFRVYIRTAAGDGGVVEDLGTEFNINAYSDEKLIKTTVAEGSVRVVNTGSALAKASADKSAVLKAGQQSQADRTGIKVVNDADIEHAMAWSHGVFSFTGESIDVVMRKLARWYDVDVVYEGEPGNDLFEGGIGMNQTLSEVLKNLKFMGMHFRIENKRIVVMP